MASLYMLQINMSLCKENSRKKREKLHSLTKYHNSMNQITKKRVTWENAESGTMTAIVAASLIQVLVGLYFPITNSASIISKDSLLQIWIPGSEDGRTLSAMGSPHGIAYEKGSSSSHQLQLYREESGKYGTAKDMITHFSQFSNQTNYLHYEIAKDCGIRGSKFLPVFVLSSRTQGPCIAVLELVTTRSDPDFGIEEYKEIKRELEKVGLTTSNNVEHYSVTDQVSSLAAQGLQEPFSPKRSAKKGKQVENSDSQCMKLHNHNEPNKDIAGTTSAPRESTIGSPSSDDKTPIVSTRLYNTRIIRIFRFKSAFTLEGLRRSVADQFNWDEKTGIEFVLRYVNGQGKRVLLIDSDDHVMGLFGTSNPPVVFVMDVEVKRGNVSAKGNKKCKNPNTRRLGVRVDIDPDDFKLAYEAVDCNTLTAGERDEMVANIIDAKVGTVKALRRKFYSSPTPSPPDRLENGEAARAHKKMRTGESISTILHIYGNTNMVTHPYVYGADEQEPLECDHSALRMGGNPKVISHVEQTRDMSAETAYAPEQDQLPVPQSVEPVSASQREENPRNDHGEANGFSVGIGVGNHLVFYDGNGKEFDAKSYNGSGEISSAEFAPTFPLGEDIGPIGVDDDRNGKEFDATSEQRRIMTQLSEADQLPSLSGEYDDWNALGDIFTGAEDFDLESIFDEVSET